MGGEHAILSERLEDQIKAAEWARSEYQRLQREKENRLSLELMERMTPLLKKNVK